MVSILEEVKEWGTDMEEADNSEQLADHEGRPILF